MGTLAISEALDEMWLYFAKTKSIFREKTNIFLGITTCDSSIYTIDEPVSIACSFKENSIDLKRVIMPFEP